MDDDLPNDKLFQAIAFSDRPGAELRLREMEKARAEGAEMNGFFRDGTTPLTSAIQGGMGSPGAVAKLLEWGADPDLRDRNGWTPWAACLARLEDRVVADRMADIRDSLQSRVTDKSDEQVLQLERAVAKGDRSRVEALLNAGVNLNAPIIHPLWIAVENQDRALVELLLRHGAFPEGGFDETCLMNAARLGNREICQLLVEAGADPLCGARYDEKWTPEFFARENGHQALAEWLAGLLPAEKVKPTWAELAAHHPKFKEVYEKRTSAPNYDLDTEEIVARLTEWDWRYGVELSEVEPDSLRVTFQNLPSEELPGLAREIYEFCPDVIEQHFGCMDDRVEIMENQGMTVPLDLAELVEGVDFTEENFGELLLCKSLARERGVTLWWD